MTQVQIKKQSKTDKLREYLLPLTIRHAVENSPFYSKHLGESALSIKTIAELPQLPLLHKKHLTEHGDELRTFKTYPDFLMYSSGTTGDPLQVPVYREEIEACHQLLIPGIQATLKRQPPLTCTVLRVGHGTHVMSSTAPSIPCHINYGIDQLLLFLRTKHWVNGEHRSVDNLELNVLNLRQVTNELLAAGIDPQSFGLKNITISGWHVSPHERAWLESVWNVKLLDRYGVTEVNGDAKWCRLCEAYHFDFLIIPEFLDPDSGQPVESGVANMVMTGLYPFNQAVPKIRYFVNDLLEVSEARCGIAEKAVRFLARGADCVRVSKPRPDGERFQLFSVDVVEVLSQLPDVGRKEKTGFVKFRLGKTEAGVPRVDIELSYIPALFPARVEELRAVVGGHLKKKRPALEDVSLNFYRPGQLSPITKV